ncbi:MAG: hypothetical protein A2W90_15735 [Bacteroidetes bacterium GWF2_42_66]|nr:MAG: hypothetical protein A2W92_08265 [Bacteroidetes bacterium GWA2_42_15]OFY02708.1 MAG: hypothetical protein A2W89_04320 [Bacteroidetes bacterium GWE2_42_39]OFY43907.1 MAG: hypothetical protein A2W90_15735 [Bacteroidetes bacterium GWF2_42_66]HBL77569.1 hypothetical protein [Prolixibacteraceae bacterium]HCR90656.1 hypothetical protein [Prolixibacteraceae bacterium]
MKGYFRLFCLLAFFTLSVVYPTSSQVLSFYINGKITDKESNKPIHLAELFISGSSIGTATDEKGNFKISIPLLPCYLVVTHRDYDPFATYIENFMDSIHIALSPSSINPDDYTKLSNSERKKEVRFFCQQFIGDDLHTSYNVLNESVLYFTRTENNFQATSNMPLVIINNHLGYKIRVLIREFDITKRDDLTHEDVPLNSYSGFFVRRIMGHYYYEPIDHGSEAQLKRYEKNRQNFYYGSYRHFLKALYDGEIMEQGYQLTFYPPEAIRNGITFTNLSSVKHSPSRIKECVMNADSMKVDFYSDANGFPINLTKSFESFNKETSVIFPSSISVKIRPNGTSPNVPFDVKGPMGDYYFINTLPDDYEPIRKEEPTPTDNNARIQELIKLYEQ